MVILDTDLIIDYIRQLGNKNSHLAKLLEFMPAQDFAVSIITIQELYVGESSKVARKEEFFLKLINMLTILPYEYEVAKLAGEIMRDIRPRVQFADAAIAATAILNKAKLFTLNKKDFKGISRLKLI
ncbi:PIN domain-containing protein [Candidatus Daviesbacteria bacterium]|nr:PIN domain-containing protein [Candidatus Daviesbacteria bacterium]